MQKNNYERGNLKLNIKGKKLGKRGSDLYTIDTNELSGFYLSTVLKNDLTILKDHDQKESLILSYHPENGSDENFDEHLVDAVKLSREIANNYGVHLHVSKDILNKRAVHEENKNKNLIINHVFSKGISQPLFVHELDHVPDDLEITIKPPIQFYNGIYVRYHTSQSSLKTSSEDLRTTLIIPEKQNIILDNSNTHSKTLDGVNEDDSDMKITSDVVLCTLDKDNNEGFNLSNVKVKDSVLSGLYEFEYSFENINEHNEHYKVQFKIPKMESEAKHIFNINKLGFYNENKNVIFDIDFKDVGDFNKNNDKYTVHLPSSILSDNVHNVTRFITRAAAIYNTDNTNRKNAGDIIRDVKLYGKFGINLPDYLHNIYKLMNEQRMKIIFNPEKFSGDYFYFSNEFSQNYLKMNDRDKTDFTEDYKKIMETIIDKYLEPQQKIEANYRLENS